MSNQHVLKIHPAPLADLMSGAKTAEVRRNDRGFQVGDTVRLMEVNPETLNWTGRPDLVRTISHIQTGYGLPDGLCVLSYADTALREALARVEADHEANGLEYGEALILIGQVLDCRSLEDLNAVRRYLNEFMDRYSLRPVPDVDLIQAEQQEAQSPMAKIAEGLRQKAADEWANHPSNPANQEAQGAQAGEFQREERYIVIKRKDLEKAPALMAYALQVALDGLREHLPKRECLVIESDWPEYEPTWAAIQARVEGRATQAVAPDEVDRFFEQAKAELRRARAKFPGDRIMTLALAEEFGELCKAVLDESAEAVRKEAVQVACMAARVVLDGDGSVVDWRRERGLDPLLAAVRGAEHE